MITPRLQYLDLSVARMLAKPQKKDKLKWNFLLLFFFFKENKRRGLVIYKYLSNAENTAQIALGEKFFLKATWGRLAIKLTKLITVKRF